MPFYRNGRASNGGLNPTQSKTVRATTSQQIIYPDAGYDLTSVTIQPQIHTDTHQLVGISADDVVYTTTFKTLYDNGIYDSRNLVDLGNHNNIRYIDKSDTLKLGWLTVAGYSNSDESSGRSYYANDYGFDAFFGYTITRTEHDYSYYVNSAIGEIDLGQYHTYRNIYFDDPGVVETYNVDDNDSTPSGGSFTLTSSQQEINCGFKPRAICVICMYNNSGAILTSKWWCNIYLEDAGAYVFYSGSGSYTGRRALDNTTACSINGLTDTGFLFGKANSSTGKAGYRCVYFAIGGGAV